MINKNDSITARKENSISLQEARRLALTAQGFGAKPTTQAPSATKMLQTIRRIGLLQLDSVNVLVRSHYLPLFSRLGPYPRSALDELSQKSPRALFEYWGHEASLIPMEMQPLFRWRMDEARSGKRIWGGPSSLAKNQPDFVASVHNQVADLGPLTAGEVLDGGKSTGNWWGWSNGKRALEYLFWTGQLTSAGRRGFERLYDLPERIIAPDLLNQSTPSKEVAQRELLKIAVQAHGVATETDLRDYFRIPAADAKARIAELIELGGLSKVTVEGWKPTAYTLPKLKIPRASEAQALLSPFDSLIWARQRTERLFDFHYRLAFYTPKEKRTQGYYVMPFLLNGKLVARVDLKSDRKAKRLLVLGGHVEPHMEPKHIVGELSTELKSLAHWLGLERVTIKARTELARALRRV